MDAERFDAFTRRLIRSGSRRSLLHAVGSGGLALLALADFGITKERGADRKRHGRKGGRGRDGGANPKGRVADRAAGGPTGRISNGTPVPQGTYTFAAAIQVTTGPTSGFGCSGSLIDSAHVLTAAHCVYNLAARTTYPLTAFSVVVGQVNRNATCPGCRKRVTGITYDTRWEPADTFRPYDVAVLTLDSPVPSSIARPIALIGADQRDLDAVGRTVTAAGWGVTATGGSISQILMQAPLTILDNATTCRADSATAFCTSVTDGRDTCGGDSGGPLFVNSGGDVLVGIVSAGPAGCPSQGSSYGALNVRLSNPSINAFVRANAPGAGPLPPPGPPDPDPPTVSIAGPASVKKFQPFTISATASSDTGIARVELFDCSFDPCTFLAADEDAPYGFDLTLDASGLYSFVARAIDTAGGEADSNTLDVNVKRKRRR